MPILFTCPHCGLQTHVGDEYVGQSGPCARCGNVVTVPRSYEMAGPAPRPPSRGMSGLVITLIVLGVLGGFMFLCMGPALLLPAVQAAREAARRSQCTNNLRQIGLALHNYHGVYQCFPPAVMTDKKGRAIRSWRVAILPYLDADELYKQYDFNEWWDSRRNRLLGNNSISAYRCPSDRNPQSTETNYVMVVGEDTVGGKPNETVSLAQITRGSSNTIAVVEVTGLNINWEEPKDITVDELIQRLANHKANASAHPGGFNALMADGSVLFISSTIDSQALRTLLLRDRRLLPNERPIGVGPAPKSKGPRENKLINPGETP